MGIAYVKLELSGKTGPTIQNSIYNSATEVAKEVKFFGQYINWVKLILSSSQPPVSPCSPQADIWGGWSWIFPNALTISSGEKQDLPYQNPIRAVFLSLQWVYLITFQSQVSFKHPQCPSCIVSLLSSIRRDNNQSVPLLLPSLSLFVSL